MLYIDTSFLVPLFLQEATSTKIERFIARQAVGELAISQWSRLEFSSLLAREVRTVALDPQAALEIDNEFEAVVGESFVVLSLTGEDFGLSKRFLQHYRTGLRAGDALHLAVAVNHGARRLYTLDKRLIRAGKQLGIPVASEAR